MNVRWLTVKAWLDADGTHVWIAHDCVDEKRVETMLPSPPWSVVNGRLYPSFHCTLCDCHDANVAVAPEGKS